MPAGSATKIHHLRSSGATLFKSTTHRHLAGSEAKANPAPIADNAVVEAFGLGKCPRLVRLLNETDEAVLIHTLKSLGGVLNDPKDAVACFDEKLHVLEPLSRLIYHNNIDIQQLVASALCLISSHANGRAEFLSQRTMRKILRAFVSTDDILLTRLLDTALNISTTLSGAQDMTQNSYVPVILDKLKQESSSEAVVLRKLRLLKAFVNDAMSGTVIRIVDAGAIELTSKYIFSKSKSIQVAAIQLIGAMMYLEGGRDRAMEHGVVKRLCKVLMDKESSICKASAGALMVLAIHDDAKREFHAGGAIPGLLQLLYRQDFGIQLNVLKLVAALAPYPPARQVLRTPQMEKVIRTHAEDSNELLARAAHLALNAITWMP
ncbi:unnamed protein product [Aphanomyces euteiches]